MWEQVWGSEESPWLVGQIPFQPTCTNVTKKWTRFWQKSWRRMFQLVCFQHKNAFPTTWMRERESEWMNWGFVLCVFFRCDTAEARVPLPTSFRQNSASQSVAAGFSQGLRPEHGNGNPSPWRLFYFTGENWSSQCFIFHCHPHKTWAGAQLQTNKNIVLFPARLKRDWWVVSQFAFWFSCKFDSPFPRFSHLSEPGCMPRSSKSGNFSRKWCHLICYTGIELFPCVWADSSSFISLLFVEHGARAARWTQHIRRFSCQLSFCIVFPGWQGNTFSAHTHWWLLRQNIPRKLLNFCTPSSFWSQMAFVFPQILKIEWSFQFCFQVDNKENRMAPPSKRTVVKNRHPSTTKPKIIAPRSRTPTPRKSDNTPNRKQLNEPNQAKSKLPLRSSNGNWDVNIFCSCFFFG